MSRYVSVLTLVTVCIAQAALAQSSNAPPNDLPQPYRTTRDWGALPAGMKWPAVTAVESAPDGTIYVVARCFENACTGRKEPAILKYDAQGTLLKAWGEACSTSRTEQRSTATATCGGPMHEVRTAPGTRFQVRSEREGADDAGKSGHQRFGARRLRSADRRRRRTER